MIKNHPHQYVYFNILAGKNYNKNFEMDYWGISNTMALESVKRVLIVDDICDTGETFKKLKDELSKELPNLEVKFASLHYNTPAIFKPDWYGTLINKEIDDVWLVYPWEDWWERDTIENTLVNEMLGNI